MQWVEVIDESLLVEDGHAVLANENKLGMGNSEFLTVCRANSKRPKAAAESLFQFLHIHGLNLL